MVHRRKCYCRLISIGHHCILCDIHLEKSKMLNHTCLCLDQSYSPVQMKFNRNNGSSIFWGCTKTIKKLQYTVENPYKMVTKNATFYFKNFNFCYVFRTIFGKLMFLKNGHGRHEKGGMPTHYVFIFHEFQWGSFAESFTQKYSLVSKLQNTTFSKIALKS